MDELTEYEKLIQGVNQLANLMRVYYEALIETGFSEKEAMVFTLRYQDALLKNVGKSANNNEQ